MTPAYDPKSVAVSAFALACFSVGFSVTAAAYIRAGGVPRADTAHAPSVAEHSVSAAVTRSAARGCRLGG